MFLTITISSSCDLKEEIGKIGSAYEQLFNKQDAAGITSLFTKNYLRVTQNGIEPDNTKYYEEAFKAGLNRLEVKTTEVQSLSENSVIVRKHGARYRRSSRYR
jgi:hypothetical protein